ncbi:MAG TPA: hypothetical protein VD699_01130, partial [Nitrosopumilaceae archaeon]|nr:hypothetical protein [Nitrosopumilaceae archaeon]
MVEITAGTRSNLGRIFLFGVLFVISTAVLFPLGDAKADNIIAIADTDGDKIFEFNARSSTTVYYKLEGTSAVPDTVKGCNPQKTGVTVIAHLVTPPEVTATPADLTFTDCSNTLKPIVFSSSQAGTYVVEVLVTQGEGAYQTTPATVTLIVLPAPLKTEVHLDGIDAVRAGDRFLVSGELVDENGAGVNGKLVQFSGDGVQDLTSATTGKLEVTDNSGIEISSGKMYLHTGSKIDFGYKPGLIRLELSDIAGDFDNTIQILVTRGDGSTVVSNSGVAVWSIGHASGISKIEISMDAGGKVGISEIQTQSFLIVDKNIRVVSSFSNSLNGQTSAILADGIFTSEATSSDIVNSAWNVNAQFVTDDPSSYESSPIDNVQYATLTPLSGSGIGGPAPSGDIETGITSLLCATDTDGDALCDDWEGAAPNGVPYTVNGVSMKYNLPGTNPAVKDLLYEVDYMTGYPMDATARTNVISFFAGLSTPVNLQLNIDQQITHTAVINVWKDGDTNKNNDYEGLKSINYGTASEHPVLSGSQTNSNTATTITVSGLKITTPTVATEGKVTIAVKVTTSSISTSTSIPASVSLGALTPGLTTTGATASVSSISSTSKTVKITIPFYSAAGLTNVNIPAATVTLTLPAGASMTLNTATTSPGSPTATTTLLDAKAQAVRYLLMANGSGGRSGAAELKGNDIVITLGTGFAGTTNEQAGTITHEIGHNLNLDHGAPAQLLGFATSPLSRTDNCKPNHISVMNYARQLPTYLGAAWQLEFGVPLFPNMRESVGLNEGNGLQAIIPYSYAPTIVYGTPGKAIAVRTAPSAVFGAPSPIGIDWNGDNAISGSPAVNVNNLGFTGCNIGTATAYQSTDFATYDEVANFNFNF